MQNKRSRLTALVGLAAIAVFISHRPLQAGSSSANLNVSATVNNNCTISTADLAFGTYDPIVTNATSPKDGTGTVTITCTKNAATTIGLDAGSNAPGSGTTRAMLAGGVKLSYEIYKESARTNVWGNSGGGLFTPAAAPNFNPRSFTVYGQIPAGQDIPAGSYTDTVLATVNF